MSYDTDLSKLINQGASLNDEQKQSLYKVLVDGARGKNRDLLYSKIHNVPLSCWPCYGIFSRVHLDGNRFDYCAGQDYGEEIKTVRNLILGR